MLSVGNIVGLANYDYDVTAALDRRDGNPLGLSPERTTVVWQRTGLSSYRIVKVSSAVAHGIRLLQTERRPAGDLAMLIMSEPSFQSADMDAFTILDDLTSAVREQLILHSERLS